MASPTPMNRDEVDRALVGLGAAHDQISAAMYELDARPGLTVLRGGGLHGQTRRVAEQVLAATDVLWSHFTALGARLQQAKDVRGERSRLGETELRALTVLLRDPVVGLDAEGLALDPHATEPAAERVTLRELAGRLATGSADVNRQLGAVEAACSRIASRWEPLVAALERIRSAATTFGPEALPPADIARAAGRLADAQRESMQDPLLAAGGSTTIGATEIGSTLHAWAREVEADIEALTGRLVELTRLRDGYPRRADELRGAIAQVAVVEAQAARACAVALDKIADPGLPPAPESAPALRTHLAQLDQLHREGRWSSLARELPAAERAAADALRAAADVREAADGLLDRRTELRGRLDAYRARAARLGFAEDAELSRLHREAHDLLYTSPCDLPAATRAVAGFQRHLNAVTERTAHGRQGST